MKTQKIITKLGLIGLLIFAGGACGKKSKKGTTAVPPTQCNGTRCSTVGGSGGGSGDFNNTDLLFAGMGETNPYFNSFTSVQVGIRLYKSGGSVEAYQSQPVEGEGYMFVKQTSTHGSCTIERGDYNLIPDGVGQKAMDDRVDNVIMIAQNGAHEIRLMLYAGSFLNSTNGELVSCNGQKFSHQLQGEIYVDAVRSGNGQWQKCNNYSYSGGYELPFSGINGDQNLSCN